MPVLKRTVSIGECVPPVTPYGITTNVPTWASAIGFREGDPKTLALVKNIYPRFAPWGIVREFLGAVLAKLAAPEGTAALIWTDPRSFQMLRQHAFREERKEHKLTPEELSYRCVDIGGVRLYLVLFPATKIPGVALSWHNPGIGVSIRLAEELLKHIDTLEEVECDGDNPPPNKPLAESESHGKLRERISGYLHRAAIDPEKVKVTPDDIFLYMTGMAGIWETHNQLLEHRPGTVVVLGLCFHATIHHMQEESPHGYKHVGNVDDKSLDEFEAWLETETKDGRQVSYLILEFPSNPILASTDLKRLKKLSEKYGFVLVLDDTVGSFSNIDILAQADILVSSLTKSFSGYANVMGGSIAFNPLSPHYDALLPLWKKNFHNEYFTGDVDVILSNSEDYLARSQILNRNAAAMVSFLQKEAEDPASPVKKVLYPSVLPDVENYNAFKRKPTPDFPEPGYGCLFSVDFEDVTTAKAFYDAQNFYPGPHLGAHKTLVLCYNTLAFGKTKEEEARFRDYGVVEESLRFSAGLESVEDLIDTLKEALEAAVQAKATKTDGLALAAGGGLSS